MVVPAVLGHWPTRMAPPLLSRMPVAPVVVSQVPSGGAPVMATLPGSSVPVVSTWKEMMVPSAEARLTMRAPWKTEAVYWPSTAVSVLPVKLPGAEPPETVASTW